MITSVKLETELYKKAMKKAAGQEIFTFSELVRKLLTEYTQKEAKPRTDEKE